MQLELRTEPACGAPVSALPARVDGAGQGRAAPRGRREAWTRAIRSRRIAARSASVRLDHPRHSVGTFAEIGGFGYADVMYATAVVEGKVVRFKLSPALARAHRENRGKTMTDQEAVAFVERKRRARALRRAKPYLESRS